MSEFVLQFDIKDVRKLAERYAYEDDAEVLELGRAARERGHYTRDELIRVCRWKTPRSKGLVAENTAEVIEAATRIALDENRTDAERLKELQSLRGVGLRTASALLHVADPEWGPILEFRALESLGLQPPFSYSYKFWSQYAPFWRQLADNAGVDGCTVDRALWRSSKERGKACLGVA